MIAGTLSSDGVRLSVRIEGPAGAPTVLLLHSLGCDWTMWSAQLDALSGRFRVLAPDARGHGSSAAPDGPYSLGQLGRDALTVLDYAGATAAHVCGISMGGMVAQWLAVHAPGRVDKLILANTASRIGTAESWRDRESAVHSHGMPAVATTLLDRFFGPDYASRNPEVVTRFRTRLLTTDARGYAACCAALGAADLTTTSRSIAAETLVIAGDHDVSTPPAQSRTLAAAIPSARLVTLQATHLSNVVAETAFTHAMAGHLAPQEQFHG